MAVMIETPNTEILLSDEQGRRLFSLAREALEAKKALNLPLKDTEHDLHRILHGERVKF